MINASIATLNSLLITKQGELAVRGRDLNANSPVIQQLKAEIETIEKQIAAEKQKLVGGVNGSAVSELSAKFAEITFNLEFVGNIYKSNLAQLERARVEALQRLKYLILVTTPTIADASIYPDRTYIIGSAAIILLMIFFIVSLIVAVIREHA